MKHYALLTDGLRVLMLKDSSLELPNTEKHWPILKKRPQNAWTSALLKHITYGLFEPSEAKLEKPSRPFGFAVGQTLIIFTVSADYLDKLFYQTHAVKQWARYHHINGDSFGFKLRLMLLNDQAKLNIDLSSLHGLRCLPQQTSNVGPTVAKEDHQITNADDS